MAALIRSGRLICQTCAKHFQQTTRNCAGLFSLTRIRRQCYLRLYPVTVVKPDGSSFTIRYHEPRRIIKLPEDLSLLSEEERTARRLRRKPKKKIVILEEPEDDFDLSKYKHIYSSSS